MAVIAAVDHVAKRSEAKQITITTKIPSTSVVKADPDSLTEMIAILLDNAIKYSNQKATIMIAAKQEGIFVVIRVIGQGMGITDDALPHIFDRFYRADVSRAKDDAGGYGLGLSIAKKIADINNCTLEVEKTSPKGSTFAIKLHKS